MRSSTAIESSTDSWYASFCASNHCCWFWYTTTCTMPIVITLSSSANSRMRQASDKGHFRIVCIMVSSGMNSAKTMKPTTIAMTTSRIGSITLKVVSTVRSTSPS